MATPKIRKITPKSRATAGRNPVMPTGSAFTDLALTRVIFG